MEIWKDIEGYEGYYQVSNLGNVRSLNYRHHGGVHNLKQSVLPEGYLFVILWKNKATKMFYVHRLVGQAFLDNPHKYPEVNHIDENKQNNSVKNLEWCSSQYNTNYSRLKHPERYVTTMNGKRTKKVTKYSLRPVKQQTRDGMLIKQWNNISEIVRELNVCHSAIAECCKGIRKTAYGFKWEFADKNASSLFI